MTLETACLMLCIAYRIHGTDAAVIHACLRVARQGKSKGAPTDQQGHALQLAVEVGAEHSERDVVVINRLTDNR